MANCKLCPLLMSGVFGNSGTLPPWLSTGDLRATLLCQGPACAWYDAAAERCAVLTLARNARQ